jgi:hypothetical protein
VRTSASSDAALLESMSAKLQYSWDRYITFIHEILLLTGGTILVLLNGMLGRNRSDDMEFAGLGIGALVVAVLGMFAGMGWRLTSQFFMDREVFGAREDVQRYFEVCGIRSVSDYHDKYYGERTFRAWRVLFSVCSYASIASLLLAWILGGFFVAQNAG